MKVGLVHSSLYPRGHPHHARVACVLLILFEGFMEKALEAAQFEEDDEIRKTYTRNVHAVCFNKIVINWTVHSSPHSQGMQLSCPHHPLILLMLFMLVVLFSFIDTNQAVIVYSFMVNLNCKCSKSIHLVFSSNIICVVSSRFQGSSVAVLQCFFFLGE